MKKEDSIIKFDTKIPGPTLAIFAGIHGNEICGVKAFKKILPKIKITKGVVYFVYGNLRAIEQNVRYTESNLNRCFGKDDDLHIKKVKGTYERERAIELMEILDNCDALLDVHASTNKESTPFIICEPHSFEIAKLLPGFPIRTNGWDKIETGGTDYYMNNVITKSGKKGNGICIECGYLGDTLGQKRAEDGIMAFLKYFDVIDDNIILNENQKQREIHAYDIYITKENFRKKRDFYDFEKLEEGEIIGYDGNETIYSKKGDIIAIPMNREKSNEESFIFCKEK